MCLRAQPLCKCGEPAVIADHIIPKRGGGRDERENLQALCQACHNRKVADEMKRGGGRFTAD